MPRTEYFVSNRGKYKIVQHCTEHDRRYQIYCPMHESLCCLLCISEIHNECVGLLAIENIIKTAKTSAMVDSISSNLSRCSFIFLRSSYISLWIFRRWSEIFVRFSSLSRIALSMLLEMSFKVSSILSTIADVLAVLKSITRYKKSAEK
jgi:hypothetical protein